MQARQNGEKRFELKCVNLFSYPHTGRNNFFSYMSWAKFQKSLYFLLRNGIKRKKKKEMIFLQNQLILRNSCTKKI